MCYGPKPDIVFADTARIEVVFTAYSQLVENVFHVYTGGVNTAAGLTAIRDKFVTWLDTNWKPIANNQATATTIKAKGLWDPTAPYIESAISPPITGTGTGTALPNNVTLAIRWNTGLGGRSYRGRTFHVGLSGNNVTGQSLSTVQQAGYTTQYTALLTLLAGMSPARGLVVASYCAGGVWRTVGVTTPITGCTVDPNLDSQRRRLNGRGR